MMESISSDSHIVGTIPGALGKPGTLLEMQSLTDLTESENLGVCFNKSTEWFWHLLKFESCWPEAGTAIILILINTISLFTHF